MKIISITGYLTRLAFSLSLGIFCFCCSCQREPIAPEGADTVYPVEVFFQEDCAFASRALCLGKMTYTRAMQRLNPKSIDHLFLHTETRTKDLDKEREQYFSVLDVILRRDMCDLNGSMFFVETFSNTEREWAEDIPPHPVKPFRAKNAPPLIRIVLGTRNVPKTFRVTQVEKRSGPKPNLTPQASPTEE